MARNYRHEREIIELKPLTPEMRQQILHSVQEALRHGSEAVQETATQALTTIMDRPSCFATVFKEVPLLSTLFRSNPTLFSSWHPAINRLVNGEASTIEEMLQVADVHAEL